MKERRKGLRTLVSEENTWGFFQGFVSGSMLRAHLRHGMDGWNITLVALTVAFSCYSAAVIRSCWGLRRSLLFSALVFLLLAAPNAFRPEWSHSVHSCFDFLDDLIAGGYLTFKVYSRASLRTADPTESSVRHTIQLATTNVGAALPIATYSVAYAFAGDHQHFFTTVSMVIIGIRMMDALLGMAEEQERPEQNERKEQKKAEETACLSLEVEEDDKKAVVGPGVIDEQSGPCTSIRTRVSTEDPDCEKRTQVCEDRPKRPPELRSRRWLAFSFMFVPFLFNGFLSEIWKPPHWKFQVIATTARKLNFGEHDIVWPRICGQFGALLFTPAVRRKASPAVVISAGMLLLVGLCANVHWQHAHLSGLSKIADTNECSTNNTSLNSTLDCVDSLTSFVYAFGDGFTTMIGLIEYASWMKRLLLSDEAGIRAAVVFGFVTMNAAAISTHHFKGGWTLGVQLVLTSVGAAITTAVFWIGRLDPFSPPVDEAAEKQTKEAMKKTEERVDKWVEKVEEHRENLTEMFDSSE